MLSGDGNKNSPKKPSRSNKQKKKKALHARAAQFFVHFFAVVLHDYNVKLGGNAECVPVHFLFRCHSFSPWRSLTFLIFLPPL